MKTKTKILYVDDEPINLQTFQGAFGEDFEVLTAFSGEEGLKIFSEHVNDGLAVVISDQRMPGMSGVDFLARVLAEDPVPVRIILTAYADFHNVSEAVNKGHIFQFVQKPWSYKLLLPILKRAVEVYLLSKNNLRLVDDLGTANKMLITTNNLLQDELKSRKEEEEKRRNAEIMMLSQAKLASLGEMATGIAHEINQPLSYVNIVLQSARKDLLEGDIVVDEFIEEVDESIRQIGRISSIIDHLRSFGRVAHEGLSPVDLATIINDTLIPLKERLRLSSIDLSLEFEKDLPSIYGNVTKLEQALINLIINAVDALENCTEKNLAIRLKKNGEHNVIEVKDNGVGINQENIKKIFEPFFTTKEVGKGTGVGLAIVYGIIKEHNATIDCASVVGKGTTFTISLPQVKSEKTEC